jgi:hypothetical protein
MPGNIPNDFDSVIRELQNQNQDQDSPFGSPDTSAEKPAKATKPAKLPKPPGPRAANLQESLQTGAVDGQVVENPFVKPSQNKDSDRQRNGSR